ncbi:MAG: DsbA family protein [Chitinivibrionia bacterium]|nr:DsbA family protein [Chitinivibrionia bacterium]
MKKTAFFIFILILTHASLANDNKFQEVSPISIEIFSMSGCPFSKIAIKDFLPLFSDAKFNITIRFAGDYNETTSKVSPALPDGSLLDEKTWLAVQDLLPERFGDFLFLATVSDGDYQKIAESIGLTSEIFEKWSRERGEKLLVQNYKRALTFGINSCPSFVVDNEKISISPKNLIRKLCRQTDNMDCFGIFEAANVKLILPPRKTPNLSVGSVLENTLTDFLKVEIDTLDISSPRAQELLQRFEIRRLPAIILDNRFDWNWGDIPDGFYYMRERQIDEFVILADSKTAEKLRRFVDRNIENLHLLTDNEALGWRIWHENQNLISGRNITEAKKHILEILREKMTNYREQR